VRLSTSLPQGCEVSAPFQLAFLPPYRVQVHMLVSANALVFLHTVVQAPGTRERLHEHVAELYGDTLCPYVERVTLTKAKRAPRFALSPPADFSQAKSQCALT